MKLFRLVFWIGVLIYNLPTSAPSPAALGSQQNRSFGLEKKAISGSEPSKYISSCSVEKPCRDTLIPADRMMPWRGRSPAREG